MRWKSSTEGSSRRALASATASSQPSGSVAPTRSISAARVPSWRFDVDARRCGPYLSPLAWRGNSVAAPQVVFRHPAAFPCTPADKCGGVADSCGLLQQQNMICCCAARVVTGCAGRGSDKAHHDDRGDADRTQRRLTYFIRRLQAASTRVDRINIAVAEGRFAAASSDRPGAARPRYSTSSPGWSSRPAATSPSTAGMRPA